MSRSGLGLTFWTCDTHDGCIFTSKKPGTKPKQEEEEEAEAEAGAEAEAQAEAGAGAGAEAKVEAI